MYELIRSIGRKLIWSFVVFVFVSCASYTDETREIRSSFRQNSYQQALEKLEKSGIKEETKNRLLYRLEKAMILDRLGKRKDSRNLLLEADKIVDELYTVSITKTAASFLVNDSTMDYSGEDYEKVAIHTILALSFLQDNDLSAAAVEARKINNKLHEINKGYEDNKNRYSEDAFARYLSAMIYEAQGQADDAIIDYKKALSLYEGGFKEFCDDGVPANVVTSLYDLLLDRNRNDDARLLEKKYGSVISNHKKQLDKIKEHGDLVVIQEEGNIAIKKAMEFFFPFGKQIVRFSFPVINKERSHSRYFGATGVTVLDDKTFISATNAENLDSIASDVLEDRRLRLIAKEGARLLAKGQLVEYAHKNFGPLGGIAANIYAVVTETADTRSWTLLPADFYVTRIQLPPGKHEIKIQNQGRISQILPVTIKKGKITFLRDFD